MTANSTSGRVRFGVFEADFVSGELRKQGIKIKVHDQPLKVLAALLEHPGEVVTREQLCQRLWAADTFVDSEVGLNSTIKKLRDALGDSPESPRFIETLPRRGYRWIGGAEAVGAYQFYEPRELVGAVQRVEGSAGMPAAGPMAGWVSTPVAPQRHSSLRYWAIAMPVLLVVAFLGAALWIGYRQTAPYTVAVLPLRNLSAEAGNEYFSDGLTDEIISNLSLIDGLQVKSRTSSFAFKDKPRDIHAVSEQLGAKYILEGSVLREGDRLRVNVQLIRAADDQPLWSNRYDRKLRDVFTVQDEISRSIVNELRLRLGRGQRRYNTNLEAYDLYLRARELTHSSPGVQSDRIASSIPLFEATIVKDPNFAPAYAGIADAYAYLSVTPRAMDPSAVRSRMRTACEKALQLDPLLAEAYSCTGQVNAREYRWAEAEQAYRRASQLNKNLAAPHHDLAMTVLFPEGRLQDAVQELRTAVQLDPLSSRMRNSLGLVLLTAGRYDEAWANSQQILAGDPQNYFARMLVGRIHVLKGNAAEGISIFESLGIGSESFLGYAYGKAGRRLEAEKIATQHLEWPWAEALVYASLGDKDKTIDGLQKMAAIRDPRAGYYQQFPEFALVRGDVRLNAIRKELGLPGIE